MGGWSACHGHLLFGTSDGRHLAAPPSTPLSIIYNVRADEYESCDGPLYYIKISFKLLKLKHVAIHQRGLNVV